MVYENVIINYKRKKISLEVKKCSLVGKGIGLMFSKREKAKVLLFEFENPNRMGIHSYFVFFEFLAVWVDEDNNAVQVDCVKPWTSFLRPKKKYMKLIEIPINKKNKKIVKKFLR